MQFVITLFLDFSEGNKLFTLILRAKPDELKDHYLTFKFLDDTIENLHFLYRICKLAAYVTHTPDPVRLFLTLILVKHMFIVSSITYQ